MDTGIGISKELFEGLVKVKQTYWVYERDDEGNAGRRFTDKEKENIVSCKVIQGQWSRACLFTLKNNTSFCITIEKSSLLAFPELFQVDMDVNVDDLLFGVKVYVGPESNNLKKGTRTARVIYEKAEPKGAQEVTDFDNPFHLA